MEVSFDTLKFVQTLKKSGFTQKKAESLAFAIKDSFLQLPLSTKNDLKFLELKLIKWISSFALIQISILISILIALL